MPRTVKSCQWYLRLRASDHDTSRLGAMNVDVQTLLMARIFNKFIAFVFRCKAVHGVPA